MKKKILYLIIIILIIAGFYYSSKKSKEPGEFDSFAECLNEKEIKMYGAFWCSACKQQKELFGRSFNKINYIECGVKGNTNLQTEICQRENIPGYPTWEFSDSKKETKIFELEELASLSGCDL